MKMCLPLVNLRTMQTYMLTSDDRKEVDFHLQRGSFVRDIFRDVLERLSLKIFDNSNIFFFFLGGGGVGFFFFFLGGGGGVKLKLTRKNKKYNIK